MYDRVHNGVFFSWDMKAFDSSCHAGFSDLIQRFFKKTLRYILSKCVDIPYARI